MADLISRRESDMGGNWEDDIIRKGDLIDWIAKVVTTYEGLQYLYRDSKDCTEVIITLNAVADHVHWMKPYDSNEMKEE